MPSFDELENPDSNLATEIISSDGVVLGQFYRENRSPVTYDELPKLYDLYKERKYDGVAQFVADKRGIPNIYWKDEGSDFQKRVKDSK